MKQYHPLIVTLHWLLASMIILALAMGTFVLAKTSNADPEKIKHLQTHMPLGILILILMISRFVVRLLRPRPAPVKSGNLFLDRLARLVHILFYLVVIAMALSGLTTSIMAGLPQIVFGGTGQPLPANFNDLLPRAVHGFLATALIAMISIHLAGFVFHQFIRKENLIGRMWFARKSW